MAFPKQRNDSIQAFLKPYLGLIQILSHSKLHQKKKNILGLWGITGAHLFMHPSLQHIIRGSEQFRLSEHSFFLINGHGLGSTGGQAIT